MTCSIVLTLMLFVLFATTASCETEKLLRTYTPSAPACNLGSNSVTTSQVADMAEEWGGNKPTKLHLRIKQPVNPLPNVFNWPNEQASTRPDNSNIRTSAWILPDAIKETCPYQPQLLSTYDSKKWSLATITKMERHRKTLLFNELIFSIKISQI